MSGSSRNTVSPKRRRSSCRDCSISVINNLVRRFTCLRKQPPETLKQMLVAGQQLRLHQGSTGIRVGHGLAAGLFRGANAVAEDQAGVEYVAQQAVRQRGPRASPRPKG